MEITSIRGSTLNSFQDCPFKFYLLYQIGFPSVSSMKADLGSISHQVLEILAKIKKTGHYKLSDKYCDPEYLLNIVWERYKKEKSHLWDFNQANYEFCRKQVQAVLDSPYHPFKQNVVKTEQQFELDLNIPGFQYDHINPITNEREIGYCKLRGTIDLVVSPNTDTIAILDYKTGERKDWITGKVKELEDFKEDLQFQIYFLAIKTLYPNYKVVMITVFFTRSGGPFTNIFEIEEIPKIKKKIQKLYQKILKTSMPSRLKDDPSRSPMDKEGWKCCFLCEYGLYEFEYQSNDGTIHTEKVKFKNIKTLPATIEKHGKTYKKVTKFGTTTCDRYYDILQTQGIENGSKTLYQISINGQTEKSRRNDYSRANISRGVIE